MPVADPKIPARIDDVFRHDPSHQAQNLSGSGVYRAEGSGNPNPAFCPRLQPLGT